jgi:hypothetical protein
MENHKESILLQALSVIESYGIAVCYLTFFHREDIFCTVLMLIEDHLKPILLI